MAGRRAVRLPMVQRPERIPARVIVRAERCKGCEYCIEFCPERVLAFSRDFNPKGYHYPIVAQERCIDCGLCTALCPEYAIFTVPRRRRPATAADQASRRPA